MREENRGLRPNDGRGVGVLNKAFKEDEHISEGTSVFHNPCMAQLLGQETGGGGGGCNGFLTPFFRIV